MSILYTITAYPPSIGGAQLHLHEYVKRIAQSNRVGVMYHWNENRIDFLQGTTLTAPYNANGHSHYESIPVYQLSLDDEQRQELRFWIYTYYLTQTKALDRISQAFLQKIQRASPMLLGETPDIIHNSRVGREGLTMASLEYARSLDVPFVLTPNHHHHWRGWMYRHYIQIYRQSSALIAHTSYERDELIRLKVNPSKIHVLGIGPVLAPDWNGDRFRMRFGIPQDCPVVLYLGQKYEYKRFQLLLEAMPEIWAKYPETRFVFLGPRTPYSCRIFARIHDPRVIETDVVDLQTKTDALDACDMLCMPSSKESFGGVYVEAWMLCKPVIGGDAPAVREVISDGQTGFTVGDDVELLSKRMLMLLDDPMMASEMGAAGRQAAERFAWPVLSKRLQSIYDGLR